MYDSHLLDGEQRNRRRHLQVEEAVNEKPPSRSVLSMCQRFESNPSVSNTASTSAPVTPAKKKASQTKSKDQVYSHEQFSAIFKGGRTVIDGKPGSQPFKSRISSKDAVQNTSVGSLIERWGGTPSKDDQRPPFHERDLQRVDQTSSVKQSFVDSVDTFGSSSVDLDSSIPKTDPGPRLEAFAAQITGFNSKPPAIADAVVTEDQNLRDLVARGIQHQSIKATPKQASSNAGNSALAEDPLGSSSHSNYQQVILSVNQTTVTETVQIQNTVEHGDSDWGAGDVYIRELFAKAEETAERAVHCDENEEYFEAFELYWVVVDLYYKIIPFLSPEEGIDVHERIKMYTRRCGLIREAFEDDPEGQDEIEIRIADATAKSAQKEEQILESFNNGTRITHAHPSEKVQQVETAELYPVQVPIEESPVSIEETAVEKKQVNEQSESRQFVESEDLQRTRFPDPQLPELPMAVATPHGASAIALSASTQAHRNSLSRPISRSAVRASTSSVSRERMAEMQERVQIMQQCLNNFTVRSKHLGPARALEHYVTTLNANTFGDLKRLEPLPSETEHRWASEIEVVINMLQDVRGPRPDGGYGPREDVARHLPNLERCDRSVRKTLQSFSALPGHVKYVERETASGSAKGGRARRRWWVKVPVVAKGGLPEEVRRVVKEAEEEMRGVFKVCHEINVGVVRSMLVPPSFVETLPKHARMVIPRELKEALTTWGMFKVSDYMKDRNLWNREDAKAITSSLEKVALIWEARTFNQSFFSRTLDFGGGFQRTVTAFRRCQNAIRDLRREWYVCLPLFCTEKHLVSSRCARLTSFFFFLFIALYCTCRPTMQHTDLDMAKIQHNEDIGHAGLEAYSRALESRAYRLLTRIRELLEADDEAKGVRGRSRPKQ